MTTTELPTSSTRPPDADRTWWRRIVRWRPRRGSLPDPLTGLVVAIVATFALLSIGPPLVGMGTFAGVDTLAQLSPQRDESMAGVRVQTINMGDTVDFALPNEAFFGDELRHGEYAEWNPYILGGVPLAATPNFAVLSPVALPFWFLPGWLAPAYVKLLELIVAVGGCYLFLRRVRLGKASSWLGGLAFASSGYLIVWSNWPQSRVAVFIPVLFWALERLVQQRRPRDVALVALPVAAMILSGFPSVTGYAVLTGGAYFLARVLAEHQGRWRRITGLLAAGGAGVLGGVALVAFQLLPWVYFMSHTVIRGREQTPEQHIPPEMLLTTVAPYLFGTVNPAAPPTWFHARIFIEYSCYVGAAALVLVGVALAAARAGRTLLPRGVWIFLVVATAGWLVLIFYGGTPLAAAQKLPVLFSQNFVGRARSMLGFLLAVLAAVGFQLLLQPRDRRVPTSWLSRGYAVAVWLVPAAAGLLLVRVARRIAYQQNALHNADGHDPNYVTHLMTQLGIGLGFAAVATLCAAWLWWGARPGAEASASGLAARARRCARPVAAGLIPVLIGVQALMLAVPYHPRVDRDEFYPMTDAARYLQTHLGHDRYYGATGAIYGGIEVPHRIRALHGHIYLDKRYAELVETMPGEQFDTPPTYLNGDPVKGEIATHPVLDLLGVSHYMISAEWAPYGTWHVDHGDGSKVALSPGHRFDVALTAQGPIRGVGFTPEFLLTPPKPTSRVIVTLKDSTGHTVAEADKIVRRMEPGKLFFVPLAAESTAKGQRLTAEIEVTGPVTVPVAGRDGAAAISTVTAVDDGLRLVYDDSSVIYQRTHALPRARWASRSIVEPDQKRRLDLLSNGKLAPDQVVLDAAGAPADGKPARVSWIDDGNDEMSLRVDAAGAGYLVVADAIQPSWGVTVDGRPATLVPADHALAAVAVPAGHHTVRLFYQAPYHNAGGWISGLTALLLLGLVGAEYWHRRRSQAVD
jgi:hypothetical protein